MLSSKISVFFLVVVLVGAACSLDINAQMKWQQFKAKHAKTYANSETEASRFVIWQENLAMIAEHNKRYDSGEETYYLGENAMADLTSEEFQERYTNKAWQNSQKQPAEETDTELVARLSSVQNLPAEKNWIKEGAVTEIKDQGSTCGACWAFTAAATLEGHYVINYKAKPVSFSVQQLLDCDMYSYGCNGGWAETAFDYLAKTGLEGFNVYPYREALSACVHNNSKSILPSVKKYSRVKSRDEKMLQSVVALVGPVATALNSHDLQFYNGGVYNPKLCPSGMQNLDHAVTIVGYGTDTKGGDYWIVKNSWGTTWGQQGYLYIKRNSNVCGIATDCSVPQLF